MATIYIKRGAKARLPTLKAGEPALCSDTEDVYVGNGSRNIRLSVLPDQKLLTLTHNLDGYPLVLLLSLQYGAGMGGAGEGPAGGTDPVQYPCRAVYHSRSQLTVYTIKSITNLGSNRTLTKINPYEYTVTFGGISADSLYVKLILNMGGTVAAAAGLNLMAAQPVEGGG